MTTVIHLAPPKGQTQNKCRCCLRMRVEPAGCEHGVRERDKNKMWAAAAAAAAVAPHNERLHQEVHFILFGADFWKCLRSGERIRKFRSVCAALAEREESVTSALDVIGRVQRDLSYDSFYVLNINCWRDIWRSFYLYIFLKKHRKWTVLRRICLK